MKIDRPSGPTGPDAGTPVAETERAGETKASFADALGKTATEAAGAVEPSSIEALVQQLRAGEIGIDAVLDTLVSQAVEAAPLGARGKEQLREVLRSALENDPTLRRLAREIEQG